MRQANGGEVVKLDTKADIVIADHARRDSPAGSISWKYIEESVKDAELKDTEKYPAGAPAHIPRQIGSGQSTRKGRVPFTAEDDRILAKWVADAERAGLALKGNALYQQLEAKVEIVFLTCVHIRLTERGRITDTLPSHGATITSNMNIVSGIFEQNLTTILPGHPQPGQDAPQ